MGIGAAIVGNAPYVAGAGILVAGAAAASGDTNRTPGELAGFAAGTAVMATGIMYLGVKCHQMAKVDLAVASELIRATQEATTGRSSLTQVKRTDHTLLAFGTLAAITSPLVGGTAGYHAGGITGGLIGAVIPD